MIRNMYHLWTIYVSLTSLLSQTHRLLCSIFLVDSTGSFSQFSLESYCSPVTRVFHCLPFNLELQSSDVPPRVFLLTRKVNYLAYCLLVQMSSLCHFFIIRRRESFLFMFTDLLFILEILFIVDWDRYFNHRFTLYVIYSVLKLVYNFILIPLSKLVLRILVMCN